MPETPWLTYDDFADRVGERFEVVRPDGDAVPLTLVGATLGAQAGGPGPSGESRLQFSLDFRGPADPLLAQGTRVLAHDHFGELALFLVPTGLDADGARYEAAFA